MTIGIISRPASPHHGRTAAHAATSARCEGTGAILSPFLSRPGDFFRLDEHSLLCYGRGGLVHRSKG
jgi:hypothetical protein